jgi:RimJ/RimL family protein N-acetyltransferase
MEAHDRARQRHVVASGENAMLKFESIYASDGTAPAEALDFLYDLLSERDETTNISHVEMPERSAHETFVSRHPYQEWWILVADGVRVGACYLSWKNEIGLFILRAHRGNSYGRAVIAELKRRYDDVVLHANINPRNKPSISLFEGEGFEHCQNTYRWKPPSD